MLLDAVKALFGLVAFVVKEAQHQQQNKHHDSHKHDSPGSFSVRNNGDSNFTATHSNYIVWH